jgi:hypothetical protein
LVIIAFLIPRFFQDMESFAWMASTLLIVAVTFLAYPLYDCKKNDNLWNPLFKVFIAFYLLECGMAISENIMHRQFFQTEWSFDAMSNISDIDYRAHALHGHPLQNALIVSIIMNFFLTSALKPVYKYFFWGFGFLAILSFNTRSSIVGNAAVLVAYTFYILLSRNTKTKLKIQTFILLLVSIVVVLSLLFSGKFGGRLLDMGLLDNSSAVVRINIWRIFDYYKVSDFLFGMSVEDSFYLLESLALAATENFWIDWLLMYGAIFLVTIIVVFFLLFKKFLTNFSAIDKTFLVLSFLLLASTNNSLSASALPLLTFLFCCVFFSPNILRNNLKSRYLTN